MALPSALIELVARERCAGATDTEIALLITLTGAESPHGANGWTVADVRSIAGDGHDQVIEIVRSRRRQPKL